MNVTLKKKYISYRRRNYKRAVAPLAGKGVETYFPCLATRSMSPHEVRSTYLVIASTCKTATVNVSHDLTLDLTRDKLIGNLAKVLFLCRRELNVTAGYVTVINRHKHLP